MACPLGALKRTTGRYVGEPLLEDELTSSTTVPCARDAPATNDLTLWYQNSAPASIARPTAENRYLTIAMVFISFSSAMPLSIEAPFPRTVAKSGREMRALSPERGP